MTSTRPRRTALLALLALGLVAACSSRTLPLPPPEVDMVAAPNAQGLVVLQGTAQEGASIGVVNDATQTGVIVTSPDSGCDRTCFWEARIEAESGDQLRVWQFFETSSSREVVVPD